MSKIPATGHKKGVIFGNPGGPGLDALGMFSDSSPQNNQTGRAQLPDDVRSSYDLIAVEPRGLTFGTPLECGSEPASFVDSMTPSLAHLYSSCEQSNPSYLKTITTENTARDFDQVRQALHQDSINLYGTSYGGALMSTYATLFPDHTNKVILDSSISPNDRWFKLGSERKQIRLESIRKLFEWIADNDQSYHLGTTPREVYQRFVSVSSDKFGVYPPSTPQPANSDDANAAVGSSDSQLPEPLAEGVASLITQLDYANWKTHNLADSLSRFVNPEKAEGPALSTAPLADVMYSQPLWPKFAEWLANPNSEQQGESKDSAKPSESELKVAQAIQVNLQMLDRTIICNENMTPPDPSTLPSALASKYLGGDFVESNEDEISSGLHCLGWPEPEGAPSVTGEALKTKPLNLGYDHDTAVTPHGATDTQQLMGGELHTFSGYSHAVLFNNPVEAAPIVSEYMK